MGIESGRASGAPRGPAAFLRRLFVDAVAAAAALVPDDLLSPAPMPIPAARSRPGRVYLTFDDGPSVNDTDQILAVLRDEGVHATFFVIGDNVRREPEILRREVRDGHSIGVHSWNHPDLTKVSPEEVRRQMSSCCDLIRTVTGVSPRVMRPPFGRSNATVGRAAASLGLRVVKWDVDSLDWTNPGVEEIVRNTLPDTGDGSVVLMHDGGSDRSQTVAACREIIRDLKQTGIEFAVM